MLEALRSLVIYGGSFVLVLSLVVFVHEYGHYRAARMVRIAIETFSIGFGKTLRGWRDRHGVEWKIGALPLGGYVKFQEDADPSGAMPVQAPTDPEALAAARAKGLFYAQPLWARAFVVAAGPLTNFLFSILAFGFLAMAVGHDVTPVGSLAPRIDNVQDGSPAARAGLMSGDVVREIDGAPISTFGELQRIVSVNPGKEMRIVVGRGGGLHAVTATPEAREGMDEAGATVSRGVLGIARTTLPSERKIVHLNPIEAIGFGAEQTWKIISMTVSYLGNVLTGKASGKQISGPIGILDMSGQITKATMAPGDTPLQGLASVAAGLLGWAATLSVAVGFANLLPIPVLDGGHLVFYMIEAVRGRPLSPQAQMIGFRAGLAALGSLFLFATWNDLQRLNILEFLSGMLS